MKFYRKSGKYYLQGFCKIDTDKEVLLSNDSSFYGSVNLDAFIELNFLKNEDIDNVTHQCIDIQQIDNSFNINAIILSNSTHGEKLLKYLLGKLDPTLYNLVHKMDNDFECSIKTLEFDAGYVKETESVCVEMFNLTRNRNKNNV